MSDDVIIPAGELIDMAKAADAALTIAGVKPTILALFQNGIGAWFGDRLHVFRHVQLAEFWLAGQEKVRSRGREPLADPSPSLILPILEARQDETRETLKELFEDLLAAALDPAKSDLVRRDFIEIVRKMEPIDAQILHRMNGVGSFSPNLRDHMAQTLQVRSDAIETSLFHLIDLKILMNRSRADQVPTTVVDAHLTARGREFLKVLYG